jgi:3,4-dihydroxy 2-butanone 4-phosphate synthase/GTP cyclohydrolase II
LKEGQPVLFATVHETIEEIRQGRLVIVVDDEDRENEGDLIMAAQFVTPEAINFIEKHARGMLCVPVEAHRLEYLDIPLMVEHGTSRYRTAFTITVDARHGTTTGISARDQYVTIQKLVDPTATAADFLRPGHVQPLRAEPGGVLKRAGHTEAAMDLVKLAGLFPAAILCEIKNEDGSMARLPQLEEFAERHGMKTMTVNGLIKHRGRTEKLVRRAATTELPTRFGVFKAHAYESLVDDKPYLALTLGDATQEGILVRVHSSCTTGDVFHSLRCDCGDQLETALRMIQEAGAGVLLYIQQEGRGIGLMDKLRAYEIQDHGKDTVEANELLGYPPDLRDYGVGTQILLDLGCRLVRILTNNPKKLVGVEGYGLEVMEQIPLQTPVRRENIRYLEAKKTKLGHTLDLTAETLTSEGARADDESEP